MNSQRSIIDKLSLNKYPAKLILNKPADIVDFDELEYDSVIKQEKYDLVFIFVFSLEEFNRSLQMVINNQLISETGYLYFAYPKKNNPQYDEFIDRDVLYNQIPVDEQGYVPNSQLKFSRMVSLNEVFTTVGLKSEKKKKTTSSKASQCVDDYIHYIEDIKQFFKAKQDTLDRYEQLTFGYQKDWARYVFSAKKKETQDKRLLEMEKILAEGYKSIDLYRRKQK
ncbi:YdeI/OmpD-associated family protein [Caldalkalibacillus mannanilyticus]|uniref:YdeI/OmpD-associated family protein n=1 Tax=Caldalkalibacillus mannanilyticus TaxID=1418 RepID=UPI00046A6E19|nr:YdeI/OmpD-associated family protein [Caldalkalibacillus mannanilyticus]